MPHVEGLAVIEMSEVEEALNDLDVCGGEISWRVSDLAEFCAGRDLSGRSRRQLVAVARRARELVESLGAIRESLGLKEKPDEGGPDQKEERPVGEPVFTPACTVTAGMTVAEEDGFLLTVVRAERKGRVVVFTLVPVHGSATWPVGEERERRVGRNTMVRVVP